MCLIFDSTNVMCLEDIPYTHIFIAKIIKKKFQLKPFLEH